MNRNQFIRHNTTMKRIIFYSILIFMFSCLIGFFYARIWKTNNGDMAIDSNSINSNTQVQETYFSEEKLSFNSTFAIKKYYDKCGHFEFNYSELPKELINLSKKEVEDLYPDWTIEEFSSTGVVLSKNEDNICNEHYVIKLNDNSVDIYHLEQDGEESLYKSTNIMKEYLTQKDISNLKTGIYVYGKGNINSVIEDFE